MRYLSVLKLVSSGIAMASATLAAQAAYGQDAVLNAAPAQAAAGEDGDMVVVTGTAIRGVAPVGSAAVDITMEDITQSGIRDASQLISELPQGSGLGTTLQTSGGRSAGLNLRGLGNGATLIMFDGHRVVPQNRLELTDPNLVPFSAIQRVEVVTDGASAIYGSDAVAGVVNYILRKPFDGVEVTARYTNTLYDEGNLGFVGGKTWDGGGIVAAFEWAKNSTVTQYDIPQLRQDLTPFGGNDLRFQGTDVQPGAVGALIVGSTVYGLPSGLNGRTPTAGELTPLLNNPDLVDQSRYTDFYTQRERFSGMLRLEQDLGGLGEITLTAMYQRRTNDARAAGDGAFTAVAVGIPTDSPYYVAGLGGSQRVIYNFRENNPDRPLNRGDYLDTGNLFLDYRVPLFDDIQLTVSAGAGVSDGCETCQPQANTRVTSTIAGAATADLFNPYLQGPQPGAENVFGRFDQLSRYHFYDFAPKIDGSLFSLPAGDVRFALGAEFMRTQYHHRSLSSNNPANELEVFRAADSSRNVYSGFAELFIPVLDNLDLNAAARYDHYSDFGDTFNPKFGFSFEPTDDLLLRGSWGTSFRAPTLSDTNPDIFGVGIRTNLPNGLGDASPVPITNPAASTSQVYVSLFRVTPLKPENSTVYSLGADYTPSFIPGLKLGVTYYNVNYKDRILSTLPNFFNALSSPENFAIYEPFFIPAPQPDTCVNGNPPGQPGTPAYSTYNPAYLPYLSTPGNYIPSSSSDCDLVGILDAGARNLGQVKQDGLDFVLNYETDVGFGTFSLDGTFTKILNLDRNVLPGTPLVSALDTIGEQVSSRGRVSASLRSGGLLTNIALNYVGGYLNNQTPTVNGVKVPNQDVPAWTTFDATISYAPEAKSGPFSGTRFTVSARNLFDRDAPIVLTNDSAADLNQHNVFGRILTLEVAKKF